MNANIADGFGLPKGSEASIYDAYSVTPKPGQYPAVFKSKVARVEGEVQRPGGEQQAIIVNRALFTEPKFEFEIPERER